MKYNKLGNTDLELSQICLGTMTFGEQNTEAEGHEQMSYAHEQGVTFFDTAELYAVPSTPENNGKTEDIIGSWFAKSGLRTKTILSTKVTGPSANLKHISEDLGFSRKRIMEAIDRSLTRLQTDYVDIYQLHWPERKTNMFGQRAFKNNVEDSWEDNFVDVIETMNDLIKVGKIRHWGLSNEVPWGTMKFIAEADKNNLPRPVSIQNPYSLLNRIYETAMAEVSIREDIGLLAYSPMAFGLLSGKYHKKEERVDARLNKFKQMSRYSSQQCYDATAKYLKLAEDNGMSLAQMSLAFVNSRDFADANIIGATNLKQLKENIESINVTLSPDVLSEIDKIQELFPNPAP